MAPKYFLAAWLLLLLLPSGHLAAQQSIEQQGISTGPESEALNSSSLQYYPVQQEEAGTIPSIPGEFQAGNFIRGRYLSSNEWETGMEPFSLLNESTLLNSRIPEYQVDLEKSRILIGFEPGTPEATIQQIYQDFDILFPEAGAARLNGSNWYLGWIDPANPLYPLSNDMLRYILHKIQQAPGVTFARPFLRTTNRDLFGLTDELFVKLKNSSDLGSLTAILETINCSIKEKHPYLDKVYKIQVHDSKWNAPFVALRYLEALEEIDFEYVDVNYVFNPIVTSNDPYFAAQWALENTSSNAGTPGADMSVPEAWNTTTGDSSIIIAIIDSGTDTLHEDLIDNMLPGYDATGGGSRGYPATTLSNDAHGTACAGIAAAKKDNNIGIAGVCPDCAILPIKVFYYINPPLGGDPLPYSTGDWMSMAIGWAEEQGAAVMSNSWGIPDALIPLLPGGSKTTEDAIQDAFDNGRNGKGSLLFFSSGNDGGAPIWPGRMPGAISVNATSQCDERKSPTSCDGESWEGNWGDSLDVSAPGVLIYSTDISGTNGYRSTNYVPSFNGTSAACPNAAGVMGLILAANPNLTASQARYIMESTCDKTGGYSYSTNAPNGTWSRELGYGRVNAEAAVVAASTFISVDPTVDQLIQVTIYPQPAGTRANIRLDLPVSGEHQLNITDLNGRQLIQQTLSLSAGPHSLPLNTASLSEGFYLLTIQHPGGSITRKFMIGR